MIDGYFSTILVLESSETINLPCFVPCDRESVDRLFLRKTYFGLALVGKTPTIRMQGKLSIDFSYGKANMDWLVLAYPRLIMGATML